MSTVVEARRLNGTDTDKTVEFFATKGTLEAVSHGSYEAEGGSRTKYVGVMVDGRHHVLRPADKITLTGRMKKPEKARSVIHEPVQEAPKNAE